jgi:hypothetical protein
MGEPSNRRFLFLVDDGWRHEKKEILLFLRRYVRFEAVTHDPLTVKALGDEIPVRLIPWIPLKRGLLTAAVMFLARELQTHVVQQRHRVLVRASPPLLRAMLLLRRLAHALGLRFYSYAQAFGWLYRNSAIHADLLKEFDVLVYMPVSAMDKRIIFEAKRAGLKIVNWIYSWDNPMKDNEFLSDADRYLVWNESSRDDVHRWHGVPRDRIEIVGPAQFDYIFETDFRAIPAPPEPYVLYACAMGTDYRLQQEIAVILEIRKILDRIRPGMKLCVRPYPFRKTIGAYAPLRGVKGIEMLDFGTVEEGRVLITDEVVRERVVQIQQAACFINFGSTIGLEAAFTGTPILQMNFNYPTRFPKHQDLALVLRNEHLRYILLPGFPNVVGSPDELERRLVQILDGDRAPFMAYSRELRAFSDPLGVKCYKDVLGEALARL